MKNLSLIDFRKQLDAAGVELNERERPLILAAVVSGNRDELQVLDIADKAGALPDELVELVYVLKALGELPLKSQEVH